MSKKNKRGKQNAEYEVAKEEYLKSLRASQGDSIRQFDTQILYISSGGLFLSITFIGDVVKLEVAVWTSTLVISWVLLAATVILSVLSHLTSYHQHEKAIQRIENDEEPLEDKFNRNLNRVVAGFFLMGITMLIVFATINLEHMKTIKPNNQAEQSKVVTPDSVSTTKISGKGIDTLGAPVQTAPRALLKPNDSSKTKK